MSHIRSLHVDATQEQQLTDWRSLRSLALRMLALVLFGGMLLMFLIPAQADVGASAARIKDIADFEGVRENQLVGYGLVVGLNGTGDSLNNSPFTKQSLEAMLERMGVNVRDTDFRTANVAAVMVTANLPAFAAAGSRIDVAVSAMGDAASLQGGMLLVTPLIGATGDVFAVAQGPVAIGGFQAAGEAASITRGVPTGGRISSGATVEKEIPFMLAAMNQLRLSLRNPDFTTARRVAISVNNLIGAAVAEPIDPATIRLTLPRNFNGNIVDLITDIEQLIIEPDQPAKVVIDEHSGIIVMGRDVRVSEVAIAQGNLTVMVTERPQVVQPEALSLGQTAVENRTQIDVSDGRENQLALVHSGVTLSELVDGLNALGIGPRDLIAILQAIKVAGALQAEIEVM